MNLFAIVILILSPSSHGDLRVILLQATIATESFYLVLAESPRPLAASHGTVVVMPATMVEEVTVEVDLVTSGAAVVEEDRCVEVQEMFPEMVHRDDSAVKSDGSLAVMNGPLPGSAGVTSPKCHSTTGKRDQDVRIFDLPPERDVMLLYKSNSHERNQQNQKIKRESSSGVLQGCDTTTRSQ